MDRRDDGIRRRGQKAVDQMWPGDRLGLGATVAPELGPDAGEGRERPITVECKLNDVLLFGLRVRLGRVFGKAVERDQTSVFRLQPAAPVRRRRVADVGNGRAACAGRWRHTQRIIVSSRSSPALRTTGAG
jgi:hypothetical protein